MFTGKPNVSDHTAHSGDQPSAQDNSTVQDINATDVGQTNSGMILDAHIVIEILTLLLFMEQNLTYGYAHIQIGVLRLGGLKWVKIIVMWKLCGLHCHRFRLSRKCTVRAAILCYINE
jgi:hypothetical protein